MSLQNSKLYQTFNEKNLQLQSIESGQKILLTLLRERYAKLQLVPKEKSAGNKQIRNSKMSLNIAQNKGELPRKFEQESRMITARNSYGYEIRRNTGNNFIRSNVKNSLKTKFDMLKRAKELGNHYSILQRRNIIPAKKVEVKKNHTKQRIQYNELMSKKSKIEKHYDNFVKFNRKLPKSLTQLSYDYINLINKICGLEIELNLAKRLDEGQICRKLLQFNTLEIVGEKLIDELKRPKMNQVTENDDIRIICRAIGNFDIENIIQAANSIENFVENTFADETNREIQTSFDSFQKPNELAEKHSSSSITLCSDKIFSDEIITRRDINESVDKDENRVKLLPSDEICKYASFISIDSSNASGFELLENSNFIKTDNSQVNEHSSVEILEQFVNY